MTATRFQAYRWTIGFCIAHLIACTPRETAADYDVDRSARIDSEIEAGSLEGIERPLSIRELLTTLGLCELEALDDEVLSLIEYHDTESSVNSYSLLGGGGVRFTTRLNALSAEVYSPTVLENTVTSFEYSVDGTTYFASLRDGEYVRSRP